MNLPLHDTTRFLDDFRTAQISHLLTAAVARFDIGKLLQDGPLGFDEICRAFKLGRRPAIVLLTGLRSLDLIEVNLDNLIRLSEYGREKMAPDSPFHLRGYIGLGAFSADVQNMIACLEQDHPNGDVSYVYHENDANSALDDPETADLLTRAMADRAQNVAPVMASRLSLSNTKTLLDVGGGHGLYSFHVMQKYPALTVTIIDRAPALQVAREFARKMDLESRTKFVLGDIHTYEHAEQVDGVLLANILHDYGDHHVQKLIAHFANQLTDQGRMLVLDAFLNRVPRGSPPVPNGPRPVAAYSALLFSICEGRCYRFDEIEDYMADCGLAICDPVLNLPAHGSVLMGEKREPESDSNVRRVS